MNEERARYIKNHGKWFDVRKSGIGTICIKAITPTEAVTEAARRWGVSVNALAGCRVRELES